MSEIKTKRFSLVEFTTRHMLRNKEIVLPGPSHYYPSEASVILNNADGSKTMEGTCLRKSYLRITGHAKAEKPSISLTWSGKLGKAIEQVLIEEWKQAGIWVDNNIKFYNKEYNISGELDCLIKDPDNGEICIVEAKSCYGYMAEKEIFGSKNTTGYPKVGHLLQTLIYLNECKDQISHARIFYVTRDSGNRKEFIIELIKDDQGVTWAVVNGSIEYRFSVGDIYARFNRLDSCVKNSLLPDPDYEKVWDPAKIEYMYNLDRLGKTKYEKWKKNPKLNPIGDWPCNGYCPYHKFCWPE